MATTTQTMVPVHLPATGERYECMQCGMEIEVVAECQCEVGQPQFICCGLPLVSSGRSFVAETKETFVEQLQAGMVKSKKTVNWLKEKAQQAQDAAQDDREADSVSQQYEKLRTSLGEVQEASGDAWKDVAKGCSESWRRFRVACEKAVSRYRN